MLRSYCRTAKQPATVRWTCERMLRSASIKMPRSRTVADRVMASAPIPSADRSSRCWRRRVVVHQSSCDFALHLIVYLRVTLHWVEMRLIRFMCAVKLRDKLSCVELRHRLGIEQGRNVIVPHNAGGGRRINGPFATGKNKHTPF